MDKVKITRELADAIDGVIKHADENILYDVTYIKNVCERDLMDGPKLMPIYNYIQKVGFKEYFKVLIYDYEVEETPEDKVKSYFHSNGSFTEAQTNFKQIIVVDVLNRLDIKIEGVNA